MISNSVVSDASILFISLSLIIQFLFPIALVIYFYRKYKISIGAVFIGALVFLVFQISTRMPLLNILQRTPWFLNISSNSRFLLAFLLAFSAGLFEEGGRYLGFKYALKSKLEWKNGIAFGIGHGGLESMYIGLANFNNLIISLMINAETFDSIIAPLLPAETAQSIKEQLTSIAPTTFLAGGVERMSAIFIQIGLSMIVLYAVKNKKVIYLIWAIAIHTIIDLPALFMVKYLGIWGSEIAIAILAVISAILTFRSKNYFENEADNQNIEAPEPNL